MSDRATIEKEVNDSRKQLQQVERDVKQMRDWIAAQEKQLGGMNEALRRITEEGISRARGDLTSREGELQRLRGEIAQQEKLINLLNEIERKQRDISALEREQEKIIGLLERHRTDLLGLQSSYDELTRPVMVAPCELVLPDNRRIPLDASRGEYLIGWADSQGFQPDVDLHGLGGSAQGVSRKHAQLRFEAGKWSIVDLGSTNGTFIENRPLTPHQATVLQDKTTVRLGNIPIFFRYVTHTTRL